MRRAHHFVFLFCVCASVAAVTTAGCGSGSGSGDCPAGDTCVAACPAGETCTPNDSGGGGGSTDGNPVGSGDGSGGSTSCTGDSGVQASDDPACNTCANANCCKQIMDCVNDPSCTGLDDCLAKCADSDEDCQLTCLEAYGQPDTATALGACAQQKCPDVCHAPDSGSVDFADAL